MDVQKASGLKAWVKSHPVLRQSLFNLWTLNWNAVRNRVQTGTFPSRFGGFWTDREDYGQRIEKKMTAGAMTAADRADIEFWRENGYVIFRKAINPNLIDQFVKELDNLPTAAPKGLKITGGDEIVPRLYEPSAVQVHKSIRIVDYYFFSESGRKLLFSPQITRFLDLVFGRPSILFQSLSFEFGSEQEIHQDTAFVNTNSPMALAACWIALEDIKEGSGELVYYPGSHRWGDFLFSGRYKQFIEERDGRPELYGWHDRIHTEAKRRGVPLTKFAAKKGDVLVWHADLAHGGGKINDSKLSRRSLVGHYCPDDVRPLYRYWTSRHKQIMTTTDGNKYMSGHYADH